MKKLVFMMMILSAQLSQAMYSDGCFHLFSNSTSYPVICLTGTMEEGIGGMGAKLTVFHTNTDKILTCRKVSQLVYNSQNEQLTAMINNQPQLILKFSSKSIHGLRQGSAVLNKTQLSFLELDLKTVQRFFNKIHLNQNCN